MHNLLHCAAVFVCHFCLATVAIRVDAERIYLYGMSRWYWGEEASHRGLYICQFEGVNNFHL